MHQNSPFRAQKSKIFLGKGHGPLPGPLPQQGAALDTRLAPSALVPPISSINRRHWLEACRNCPGYVRVAVTSREECPGSWLRGISGEFVRERESPMKTLQIPT